MGRVLDATGDLASPYLEKRIPRANLPSTAAVAENRRLMHEFDSLTAGAMWTPRILAETELVARLSRLLPRLVETWLFRADVRRKPKPLSWAASSSSRGRSRPHRSMTRTTASRIPAPSKGLRRWSVAAATSTGHGVIASLQCSLA